MIMDGWMDGCESWRKYGWGASYSGPKETCMGADIHKEFTRLFGGQKTTVARDVHVKMNNGITLLTSDAVVFSVLSRSCR
jgi:hypothetical protein